MVSPSFGEPTYAEEAPSASAGEASTQAVIDMNDPTLTSEVTEVDAMQDAFAVPPPPPDGKWRAKLKLIEVGGADPRDKYVKAVKYERMNDGKPYLVSNVEASLIDVNGKFDGIKATQYHVKSQIDKRKNVDEMTTITKAAGGQVVARGTHQDRYHALAKTLAGEPETIVETFWEASCQPCQEKAKKAGEKSPRPFKMGERNFPQSKAGVHDPVVSCPTCGASCRAQLRIGGFFNVKEVKATRGVA